MCCSLLEVLLSKSLMNARATDDFSSAEKGVHAIKTSLGMGRGGNGSGRCHHNISPVSLLDLHVLKGVGCRLESYALLVLFQQFVDMCTNRNLEGLWVGKNQICCNRLGLGHCQM